MPSIPVKVAAETIKRRLCMMICPRSLNLNEAYPFQIITDNNKIALPHIDLGWVRSMPWDERIWRRLKLRDLDVLVTTAQAKSMGKAAPRLNMSEPAICKAVADLEGTLGVPLLDRSHHGIA